MANVFAFVLTTFGLYGLTLCFVLFFKRNYLTVSNRFLAGLVLIFSVFLIQQGFIQLEVIHLRIGIQLGIGSLWYLIAPFIYFHALFLLYPSKPLRFRDVIHLLPLFLHVINIIPFYIALNYEEQEQWVASGQEREGWLYWLMTSGLVFPVQFLSYIPYASYQLTRFARQNVSRISTTGLNRILITRNVYILFGSVCLAMELLMLTDNLGNSYVIILLSMMALIFGLGYMALAKPNALFNQIPFRWSYRSRELPDDELNIYEMKLIQHMEDRIFRDPELTLDKLSAAIGLQPRQLSNLIKKKYQKSFPDYLNGIRVEAAKELLRNPKYGHWSILAIGLEVGFSSKSTFNRVFKKLTGDTPSAFLNEKV